MKRIYTYILLIACTMVFASCQKDFDGVLTATLQDYRSDSKVHLNDQRYACWDNGDKVSINGDKSHSINIDGNNATITIKTQANSYKAVYPASYDGGSNYGNYVVNLPSQQDYRENGEHQQVIDAPMVAYTDGSELQFYNLCSLLKIEIPGGKNVRSIKITNGKIGDNGIGKLHGNLDYTQSSNGIPSYVKIRNGNSTVVMNISSEYGDLSNDKYFYIVIPKIDEPHLTIEVQYVGKDNENKNYVEFQTFKMKEYADISSTPSIGMNQLISVSLVDKNATSTNRVTSPWEGSGEEATPYLIKTDVDLNELVKLSKDGVHHSGVYFKQTSSIVVGSNYAGISNFRGYYNGNSQTITINGGKNGVFESIGSGAKVENLNVVATNIPSDITLFGGIVNTANLGSGTAIIENCRIISGDLSASTTEGTYVGGICGDVKLGTLNITKCINNANIKGRMAGGIVGIISSGKVTIEECANHGSVEGGRASGGLIGKAEIGNTALSILNCYSDGAIKGDNIKDGGSIGDRVGGIIGLLQSSGTRTITNSYVAGSVSGSSSTVKWIVGNGNSAVCTNVYSPSSTNNGCDNVISYTDLSTLWKNYFKNVSGWGWKNNKIMLSFE